MSIRVSLPRWKQARYTRLGAFEYANGWRREDPKTSSWIYKWVFHSPPMSGKALAYYCPKTEVFFTPINGNHFLYPTEDHPSVQPIPPRLRGAPLVDKLNYVAMVAKLGA